jgi:hypothetical protein
MVVRMKNGKNIRGALSYNEAKVDAGKAVLILASRYGCEAGGLSFSQKLKRFTVLNDNCVTSSFNTVHISLNFSANDSLDSEKMQLIARDYMQQLGFEKQPYLVYRHTDTVHPHLHIVTTPVKASGRTINLHNLVQRKSEPARKNIEETYNLVRAEGRKPAEGLKPLEVKTFLYGKAATKQSISQIVRTVADGWQFISFEEYNLVLQQYGVLADKGQGGTRMNTHGGLQYFIINAAGEKLSVGIKASSIYTSPTIKNIEKRFSRNAFKKQASLRYTRSFVQFASRKAISQQEMIAALAAKKIHIVNSEGTSYFIDCGNKIVASPEELGISLNSLQFTVASAEQEIQLNLALFQKLFSPEFTGPDMAAGFLKKKRKKKP